MATIHHIVSDEKFIKAEIESFNQADPDGSVFYVLTGKKPLKHVSAASNVVQVTNLAEFHRTFPAKVEQGDVVVCHFLCLYRARLILALPASVLVAWAFWGGDVFNKLPRYKKRIYGELTAKFIYSGAFLRKNGSRLRFLPRVLRRFVTDLVGHYRFSDLRKAMKRVDFCLPVLRADYAELKATGLLSCPMLEHCYREKKSFPDEPLLTQGRFDILVGNSAAPENNTLEVIQALSKLDLGERRVVFPISYGSPAYAQAVKMKATELLGKRAVFLEEFLSLDKYLATIATCGVVIMNHWRQQGLGNVNAMLWRGATVLLSEKNPILHDFREHGGVIFSVENDFRRCLEGALSNDDAQINRAVLRKTRGEEVVFEMVKHCVSEFREEAAHKAGVGRS